MGVPVTTSDLLVAADSDSKRLGNFGGNTMDFLFQPWFWIAIVGFAIWLVVAQAHANAEAAKRNSAALTTIPNFSAALHYAGGTNKRGVAIDPSTNQFAITRLNQPPAVFSFDELVGAEVERNGSAIQKTNRGSQVAGAAVGGLLLGPVGLLLGGLSGSSRTIEKVKKLSLKIYTNDFEAPVSEIVFFEDSEGQKPDSILVTSPAQQLDEWYARFQTILQRRS